MFLLVSLLLLQSCTEEESNDLKGQLAAMKSTRDSLNAEIEKIEAKLGVNEVKTVAVEVLKL
jgi:septal ring factor EnvC (AmiA/AmiB activator)